MSQFKLWGREEFMRREKSFVSSDRSLLDPVKRRRVMICELFAHQHQTVRSIAEMLNENYESVARVLIEEGIISERRLTTRNSDQQEWRRSLLKEYMAILEREVMSQSRENLEDIECSLKLRRKLAGR